MRSRLRLADLLQPKKTPVKLMNVKVPAAVSAAVGRVARELGVRKNEAVIALINEGLDAAAVQLKGWKPKQVKLPPPKRTCTLPGCGKAYLAKGYCMNHYQAWRRGIIPAALKRQGG